MTFLRSPEVVSLVLALAVMGPLLLPGRLLTLDSPLALNWDVTGFFWGTDNGYAGVFAPTYASAPIALVLKGLDLLLPFWMVEKLWLVLLFWLCGLGASRLPHLRGAGRYYAGLLYTVNPFSYIRFITGQWGVLGAYALTPFVVTSFIRLLEEPRPKHATRVALLLTIIGFLQVQGLLIVLLLLVSIYLGRIAFARGDFRASAPALLLGAALFLGINLFWIVRFLMARDPAIQNMSLEELSYFAAKSPLDVLTLRGFWLAPAYVDIADLLPFWWLLAAALLFLAVYGAFRMTEEPGLRWLALGLGSAAAAGLVLAAGPGVPVTRALFEWLWDVAPVYRVFRDSQKFSALLALSYAYLGAFSLPSLFESATRSTVAARGALRGAGGLFLLVPILYALPIFGTWGQLRPVEFPQDWHKARSILTGDVGDYNVLILPWHMYMPFPWLPNRAKNLANPAPGFFSQPTLSGDDWELGLPSPGSSNPVSIYVESLLKHREATSEFGRLIAPLNAKYVLLLKAADYEAYSFLRNQSDLELLLDGETVALFRNRSPVARAYAVDSVARLNSLEDYFRGADVRDTLTHLYLLDANVAELSFDSPPQERPVPLSPSSLVKENPISYRIEGARGKYLVFTLPQRAERQDWRYEGDSGHLNLGMMPAFPLTHGDGAVTFSRFYNVYVPTYILAVGALILGILVYWGSDKLEMRPQLPPRIGQERY